MTTPTETPELTMIEGGASTDRFDYRLSGVLVTPSLTSSLPTAGR
jgi:hypothetical protein